MLFFGFGSSGASPARRTGSRSGINGSTRMLHGRCCPLLRSFCSHRPSRLPSSRATYAPTRLAESPSPRHVGLLEPGPSGMADADTPMCSAAVDASMQFLGSEVGFHDRHDAGQRLAVALAS